MLMNPELQGILSDVQSPVRDLKRAPAGVSTHRSSSAVRRLRLLMVLVPVPSYCAAEALFGLENVRTLWALLLTPLAMLWYAVDYFLHNSLFRRVLKEVAHFGLFLTPAVTLFAAGLQPVGEGWALAKVMLLSGEVASCSLLAIVLWRDRQARAE